MPRTPSTRQARRRAGPVVDLYCYAGFAVFDKHGVLDLMLRRQSSDVAKDLAQARVGVMTCSFGLGHATEALSGRNERSGRDWRAIEDASLANIFTRKKNSRPITGTWEERTIRGPLGVREGHIYIYIAGPRGLLCEQFSAR